MEEFSLKVELIRSIFGIHYLKEGDYHGGVYNGKKYMYSKQMIQTLKPEKLQKFIYNQIGIGYEKDN